jgi:hypothetical protein
LLKERLAEARGFGDRTRGRGRYIDDDVLEIDIEIAVEVALDGLVIERRKYEHAHSEHEHGDRGRREKQASGERARTHRPAD